MPAEELAWVRRSLLSLRSGHADVGGRKALATTSSALDLTTATSQEGSAVRSLAS